MVQDRLQLRPLGKTGLTVSSLGLGCSHIASLSTRASASEIDELLETAWDNGVRFFDTADIYGQGDSERRLAGIAARDGAVICTKAGLAVSVSQTLVRMAKPVLRPMLLRMKKAGSVAASARQAAEAHELRPHLIVARLEASLKRLKREAVDVFLLHSPPRERMENEVLFELLEDIHAHGKARCVGVSCQTLADADWVLRQGRCNVLQVPLSARELPEVRGFLERAAEAGVGIIAREVLRGAPVESALPPLLRDPGVSTTLMGTINPKHLLQNIEIAGSVQ